MKMSAEDHTMRKAVIDKIENIYPISKVSSEGRSINRDLMKGTDKILKKAFEIKKLYVEKADKRYLNVGVAMDEAEGAAKKMASEFSDYAINNGGRVIQQLAQQQR